MIRVKYVEDALKSLQSVGLIGQRHTYIDLDKQIDADHLGEVLGNSSCDLFSRDALIIQSIPNMRYCLV